MVDLRLANWRLSRLGIAEEQHCSLSLSAALPFRELTIFLAAIQMIIIVIIIDNLITIDHPRKFYYPITFDQLVKFGNAIKFDSI